MSDAENNLPVLRSAKELSISFSPPVKEIMSDGVKTRELIQTQGAFSLEAEALVNRKSLPQILATDAKGARIMYNNLEEEDTNTSGKEQFVKVEAVQKEVSKRIQEPRDTIQRERLRDSEKCLQAFRDAPELEKIRELEESRIRKELPAVKKKRLAAESVDCVTQEELTEPEVHHKDRVADKPRRALDENNMAPLNKLTHRGVIHKNGIETEADFNAFVEGNKS